MLRTAFICGSALTVLLPGCTVARWNHMHSEANQKIADLAVTNFQAFTGQSGGSIATRLTNLNAQIALSQTVNSNKFALFASGFATALDVYTWNLLRGQVAAEFGLAEKDPEKLDKRNPDELQKQMESALRVRINQVKAAGAVLDALAAGENAVVQEAAQRVAESAKAITNVSSKAATATVAPPSTVSGV